ncbi:MAG: GLUG motif-containing protein [Dehalococcoidia bacterium]
MKIRVGSRKYRFIAKVSFLLIVVMLAGDMAACVQLPPPPPTEIWDWYDLHAVRDSLSGSYVLMNDLDSTTAGYEELASKTANKGKGWLPIGTSGNPFAGDFDGRGYRIKDLFISRPQENDVALFGILSEGGIIKNVGVVSATVAGKQHVAVLVGNNSGMVADSYSSGSVSGDQYVGGLIGINEGTITNSHYNYNEVLINGERLITIGALFDVDFKQWLVSGRSLDISQKLSQENGRYVINTVGDFKNLLAFGQDSSLKFRLANDLDLSSEVNFCVPYLAGEFDGSGHKITNLSIKFDSVSQVGLFGYLTSSGKVSQVGVMNASVTGACRVGGLVAENHGSVSNSYYGGEVRGRDQVGGLVGINAGDGVVSNSHSESAVFGEWDCGGLVGRNEGTVGNSYSSGSVTGWHCVGGLAGRNEAIVANSYSDNSIVGWYYVGGLVGLNSQTVSNSYSTANVTGSSAVGDLVGSNHGTVSNSYSTGSVAGEWDVGGLTGDNYGTVGNSFSAASPTGEWHVGGLVGRNYGIVRDSYVPGSAAGNYYVGSVVGRNDGTVKNCYSTGNVTGNRYVGGLAGGNHRALKNSYSTGNVTGKYYVGGLTGINAWDATASDSYSTSNVTGESYVGGFTGVNFGAISDSYSSGNVSGDEYVGGLVGVNWGGLASNSFWDTETSGQGTSASGTGKTTAEMQTIVTFVDVAWDICTIAPGTTNPAYTWNIIDGQTYPFLSWQVPS